MFRLPLLLSHDGMQPTPYLQAYICTPFPVEYLIGNIDAKVGVVHNGLPNLFFIKICQSLSFPTA